MKSDQEQVNQVNKCRQLSREGREGGSGFVVRTEPDVIGAAPVNKRRDTA